MATVGIVAGDPDHILIGAVPEDSDPSPTLSVWLGRDAPTEITLSAAEALAEILLGAIQVAKGEANLGMLVDEHQWLTERVRQP